MPPIHHVVAGSGPPPLVLVHGFGCSHTDWVAQVAHFAPRHATVAVDLPCHGATPGGPAQATIRGFGSAVAGLIGALALPPAVLVGHSMGCRVVVEAALAEPSRVAGLVLVDGSQFAAGIEPELRARIGAGGIGGIVAGMFAQMFNDRSEPAVAATVTARALALPAETAGALLLDMIRYDVTAFEAALARTATPVLALQTTYTNARRERSSLVAGQTTPYLEMVRRAVPAARIEIIPGVGHFPQIDAPAETNAALARFLAGLPGGQA